MNNMEKKPVFADDSTRLPSGILLSALILLVARVLYLVWMCPYELAADEAQYWDWSRHLDWSYYSKGPGIAWLIWPGTYILGNSEWVIRLPAALCFFCSMLAMAMLSLRCFEGNRRTATVSAVLFVLIPIFFGFGQFMTIDSPYVLFWILAAWAGWRAFEGKAAGDDAPSPWIWLGLAVGIGFLFKYTILLMPVGLLVYGVWQRKRLNISFAWTRRIVLSIAVAVICMIPVLAWNQAHDWPTVSHMLGQLNLPGGDMEVRSGWDFTPLWIITYVFSPMLFLGPPAAILILISVSRSRWARIEFPNEWPARVYLLCVAAPVIIFYLLVSLGGKVELNWPITGYTTLVVLAARDIVVACDRTLRSARNWTVGFGILAAILILFGPDFVEAVADLPYVKGRIQPEELMHRVIGHRALADTVQAEVNTLKRETGKDPFVAASGYGRTALLAYYLPEQPAVYSGSSYLGGRKSSYDYFPDTNLADPSLMRHPAVLVDASAQEWHKALGFGSIAVAVSAKSIFRATDYRGPRTEETKPRRRLLRPAAKQAQKAAQQAQSGAALDQQKPGEQVPRPAGGTQGTTAPTASTGASQVKSGPAAKSSR